MVENPKTFILFRMWSDNWQFLIKSVLTKISILILILLFYREGFAQCNPQFVGQYSNDFSNRPSAEWSISKGSIPWRNGSIGPFGAEEIRVVIDSLDCHDSLRISCLIQFERTWDGNGNFCCGPDIFMFMSDSDTIFQTTFTLTESFGNYQSYPSPYYPPPNTVNNKQGTGAVSGDNFYRIEFNFPHTSDTAIIRIVQPASQGVNDEKWRLHDFSLIAVKCRPLKFSFKNKLLQLCEDDSVNIFKAIDSSIRFSPLSWLVDTAGWLKTSISNLGSNDFPFWYQDSNSCMYQDTITIHLDTVPFVEILDPSSLCEGHDSIKLQVQPIGGGVFNPSSFIDTNAVARTALLKNGVYPIYYEYTDLNGCTNKDSTTLVINALPNTTIKKAGPFCKNQGTQKLEGEFISTGTFKVTHYIDSMGYFNPLLADVGLHKVFYMLTDSNGCFNEDSLIIAVDTIPKVRILSSPKFCENEGPEKIIANKGNDGAFFGGSYIDTIGNFYPKISKSGRHKVFYKYTDGNRCSNTDSTTILVDTIPSAAITAAGPFCENGGSQLFNAAVNAGGKFSGGSFIDSAGNFDPAVAMPGTHKIYYSLTDGNSCNNTDSTTILVDTIPNAAIVAAGPFCESSGVQQILPMVNNGGTFSGGPYIDAAGNFDPATATSGMHRIYYQFTDGNNCENTDSTDIEVYLKPDASIFTAGPLCLNEPAVQLQVVENGGTFSGGAYIDAGGQFNPMLADTGLHRVIYQINTSLNCSESDTIYIQVQPLPDTSWSIDPGEGCEPLVIALSSSSPDEVRWFIAPLLDSEEKNENIGLNSGNYTLEIRFNNGYGCSVKNDTSIEVYKKPVAAFSFVPKKVYLSKPEVSFKDESAGPVSSWQWNFGDGGFSAIQNPIHTYVQTEVSRSC